MNKGNMGAGEEKQKIKCGTLFFLGAGEGGLNLFT